MNRNGKITEVHCSTFDPSCPPSNRSLYSSDRLPTRRPLHHPTAYASSHARSATRNVTPEARVAGSGVSPYDRAVSTHVAHDRLRHRHRPKNCKASTHMG